MSIGAKRTLWGQKIRANESRGQTCLDYAKCSRIWRNSINHHSMIFSGDKTMISGAKLRSPPLVAAVLLMNDNNLKVINKYGQSPFLIINY